MRHVGDTASITTVRCHNFITARRYASADTSYGPVSVCLSVTSRCSVKRDGRINVVFGMEASFDQSYTVVLGNSGIYKKNKGTPLWNVFFLNSGLGKFRHGISIVERAINLARKSWTLTV